LVNRKTHAQPKGEKLREKKREKGRKLPNPNKADTSATAVNVHHGSLAAKQKCLPLISACLYYERAWLDLYLY